MPGQRTVFGSGDLFTAQACLEMIARTGVDGVMVARGAIGNPWIFAQVRALAAGLPLPPPPSLHQQREVIAEHFRLAEGLYGARALLRPDVQIRHQVFAFAPAVRGGGAPPSSRPANRPIGGRCSSAGMRKMGRGGVRTWPSRRSRNRGRAGAGNGQRARTRAVEDPTFAIHEDRPCLSYYANYNGGLTDRRSGDGCGSSPRHD